MPILVILWHHGHAIVQSVEFGLFALATGAGIGCILADREADTFRAVAPLQVVSAFRVAFFPAVDEN